MRKILRGNDFVLRIKLNRVTPEGSEGFSLQGCSELKARLVGAFRRYELESVVSEDDASVLLARVEGDKVRCGEYGVEVVGRIQGDDWRSYKCGQIGIVECEEDADLGDGEDGNLFDGLPLVSLEDAEVLTGVKVVFDTEKLDFYAVLVDALYPRLYYIETDAPAFQQNGYYTAPVNGVAVGNVATNGAPLSPNGGTYFRVIKVKVAQMEISGLFASNSMLREVSLKGMGGVVVTSTSGLFYDCTSLASIDLSGLDFSSVTNMGQMFQNCTSLASIDLSGADFSSVTDMSFMFYGCTSLASIDLSGADFSSVTNMWQMFYNCTSLASIDLSGLDLSSVTNMGYMFQNCTSLASIDLSGLDLSSVTNMGQMFQNCTSLASIDLSGADFSSVTSWNNTFKGCPAAIKCRNTKFGGSLAAMFQNCTSLASIDLSGADFSSVTNMWQMFYNCTSLASIDLSGADFSSVTDMSFMFYGCTSLASIDLSGLDFSSVTNWYCAFYNVKADIILRGAKLSGSLAGMCRYAQDVTYMDISGADFSSVTSVGEMLQACYGLTTLIGDHTLEEVENGDVRAFVGLTKELGLYDCTKLDRASLLATIKGLADLTGETSQTLTIGKTQKARLTDEDIAIATAKNWIIA